MNAHNLSRFLIALAVACGALALPDTVLAAEAGGDRWGIWLTIGRFFNLFLLIAILVWATRKPLAAFIAARTQKIHEQLAEAQAARRQAEAKLAEIESRMSHLDDEIRELKAVAEKEAQEEYQRLLAEARQDAGKIIEKGRREIEGMTRAAQISLKAHVAELSVKLAEDTVRRDITNEDRARIFARFVTRLRGKE